MHGSCLRAWIRITPWAKLYVVIRAMSRDDQAYPEPDAFIPERFMKDGTYGSDVRDPETYQFGFGRRCVLVTVPRFSRTNDPCQESARDGTSRTTRFSSLSPPCCTSLTSSLLSDRTGKRCGSCPTSIWTLSCRTHAVHFFHDRNPLKVSAQTPRKVRMQDHATIAEDGGAHPTACEE